MIAVAATTDMDAEVLVDRFGRRRMRPPPPCLAEAGFDVLIVEEGEWVEQGSVVPFSLEQMDRQYRVRRRHRCAGTAVDRLHRGSLCRRRHGDQQRAVPPAARRCDAAVGGRLRHRANSTTTRCQAIADEVEQSHQRGHRAGHGHARRARCCAAAPSALGWQNSEIPRWMKYPGQRPERRTAAEHDPHLPAPRAVAAGARLVTGCRIDGAADDRRPRSTRPRPR